MKLSLIPKPVRIWAGRVAALELAAIIHSLQQGKLPHTWADVGALVTGAVVAATPVLQASGFMRSVSPGDPSLMQKAVSAVQSVLSAPADKRKADAEAVVAQAKADAEQAGKAAARAEFDKLVEGLKTGQFQRTDAGLVPVESGILNVAGDGEEVVIPQDAAPAALQA